MGSPIRRMNAAMDTRFLPDLERVLKSMSVVDDSCGSSDLRFLFERLRRADEALLPVIHAEQPKGLGHD